jgi:uncharacterized protein YifE (UPF0438 family)
MFNLFRSKRPKGYIAYYGLEDWWKSLTDNQKAIMRRNHIGGSVDEGEILETSASAQQFLQVIAGNIARHKEDHDFAEAVALQALKVKGDPIHRHFAYNTLIDLWYKRRKTEPNAIEKCIEYCRADIECINEFVQAWLNEERRIHQNKRLQIHDVRIPRIPSFDRLVGIYEKQKNYGEAARICDIAARVYTYQESDYSERAAAFRAKVP